jgi:hypothetical protein
MVAGSTPEPGSEAAEEDTSPEEGGTEDRTTPQPPSPASEASVEEEATTGEEAGEPADMVPPASGRTGEPGDVTAPWRPVNAPGTEERPGQGESSDDDPLVAAWESAFVSSPEGGTQGSAGPQSREPRGDHDEDEEPSLRELFWGEE